MPCRRSRRACSTISSSRWSRRASRRLSHDSRSGCSARRDRPSIRRRCCASSPQQLRTQRTGAVTLHSRVGRPDGAADFRRRRRLPALGGEVHVDRVARRRRRDARGGRSHSAQGSLGAARRRAVRSSTPVRGRELAIRDARYARPERDGRHSPQRARRCAAGEPQLPTSVPADVTGRADISRAGERPRYFGVSRISACYAHDASSRRWRHGVRVESKEGTQQSAQARRVVRTSTERYLATGIPRVSPIPITPKRKCGSCSSERRRPGGRSSSHLLSGTAGSESSRRDR